MTEEKQEIDILDQIKAEKTIKASFNIQSLQMDKDLAWTLDLEIRQILPESFYLYDILLAFNEEPFKERVRHIQGEIEDVENEATLFQDVKNKRIEKHNQRIEEVETEMAEKRLECPEIKFQVRVCKLEYKDHTTRVKMNLPDDVIDSLNRNKYQFGHYKAELSPKAI